MPTLKKLGNLAIAAAMTMKTFDLARRVSPAVLTVLSYHRIDNASRIGFDTFIPNVSAAPAEFSRQLGYVQQNYSVITCRQLDTFRRGESDLPPYPLLITFDDGYRDNYTHAYPILKEKNLPAVIFLTTNHIEMDVPLYWDFAAYCFYHSQKISADLPLLGNVCWTNPVERDAIVSRWVNLIKRKPEQEKQDIVTKLSFLLEVDVPRGAFSNLYATWDQIREMNRNGIEMGAHTCGHPILTRIPISQVEQELILSKHRIELQTGNPVISFAYPNGGLDDYSPEVVNLVRNAGFGLAFTLVNGTTRYAEVKSDPLTIRRIYVGASDTLPRFVAKLTAGRFIN